MKMVFTIAWRNVWRNYTRSFVVIGSIVIGIISLIFLSSFMSSFLEGYVDNALKYELSNIQIHHTQFKKDYDIKFSMNDGMEMVEEISELPQVKAITARSLSNGMISSARKATGVQIIGIDPLRESSVTELDSLIVEGDFFISKRRNPVVIGAKLASDLGVKLRSKVVLTFQDANGNITAGAFRIVGIVKSTSLKINQSSAFIKRTDLNKLLEIGDGIHEIAIVTRDEASEISLKSQLKDQYPDLLVEDWKELSPLLEFMLQWFKLSLRILIMIVMIALVFGIINTMLMAVLERFKELGVLMALGMNKIKVFSMILIETIFLAILGGPIGLLLGYILVIYLASIGIELSAYSEGLSSIGYDSVLYPQLEYAVYFEISIGVIATAFIAAIYPAWKAIKLRPAEAIAKI